jgi:hypothetical protein
MLKLHDFCNRAFLLKEAVEGWPSVFVVSHLQSLSVRADQAG